MRDQNRQPAIVIEPKRESWRLSGYRAKANALTEPIEGRTMAGVLSAARSALGIRSRDGLWVKVHEGTLVSAKELVQLLRMVFPERLDLSRCRLWSIDLSPDALDRLRCPDEMRSEATRGISLREARLEGAELQKAQLQGADLFSAQLQDANLFSAQLQHCDLWRAQLQKAFLEHAQLQDANLSDSRLKEADLSGAQLQDVSLVGADLSGTKLGRANLQRADLSRADLRQTDFREASGLDRVRWHNALVEKTRLYRRQIEPIQDELDATSGDASIFLGGYREAMETYLALKVNFASLGDYEGASWAYVKEKQMEKASHFPTSPGKSWITDEMAARPPRHWWSCSPSATQYRLQSFLLHVRLFLGRVPSDVKGRMQRYSDITWLHWEPMDRLRWARNWLYELLTGYGERPQMPVLWGLVTILIFALVFAVTGNVSPDFAGDPATAQGSHNFWDALTHSISAFATIGFNTLEPIGRVARLLTAIESALGIGLFALFIYTIGNRMSRS